MAVTGGRDGQTSELDSGRDIAVRESEASYEGSERHQEDLKARAHALFLNTNSRSRP